MKSYRDRLCMRNLCILSRVWDKFERETSDDELVIIRRGPLGLFWKCYWELRNFIKRKLFRSFIHWRHHTLSGCLGQSVRLKRPNMGLCFYSSEQSVKLYQYTVWFDRDEQTCRALLFFRIPYFWSATFKIWIPYFWSATFWSKKKKAPKNSTIFRQKRYF